MCQPQVKKEKRKKKDNNGNKAPSFVGKCKSLKAATKLIGYNDGNRQRFKDPGRTEDTGSAIGYEETDAPLNCHADQVYHNFDQSSALCLVCKGMSGSVGGVGWGGEGGRGVGWRGRD